jgi:hypothetical protein
VTNNASGTLQGFDAATGTLLPYATAIATGSSGISGVAYDSTQNAVWVVNTATNTLQRFDAATGAQIGTNISTGLQPYDVAYDSTQNAVWVANSLSNTLQRFDAITGVAFFATPIATDSGPYGVAYDPTQNAVWVTNNASGTLQGFNAQTGVQIGSITTGSGPRGVAYDPAQNAVWVVNSVDNTLQRFDISVSGPTATGNAEKFQACVDACAGAGDPAERCLNLPRSLVPGVNTAWVAGNCSNAIWLAGIQASIPEAENQVAKFRLRYNFLNGRLTEMDNILDILGDAETAFYNFLTCDDGPDADTEPDGPACRLIRERISYAPDEEGTGWEFLPYYAIYAWQSEPEAGEPSQSGSWHVVRVDVRIPSRCQVACGVDQQVGFDAPFPWVRTDVRNAGFTRCYTLEGSEGVVKMRVARWDESGEYSTIRFPGGTEIWQPRYSRPDRPTPAPSGSYVNLNAEIRANCSTDADPDSDPNTSTIGELMESGYYDGAFILNKPYENQPCWTLMQRLLASGVITDTCARYYQSGFRFVPCQPF